MRHSSRNVGDCVRAPVSATVSSHEYQKEVNVTHEENILVVRPGSSVKMPRALAAACFEENLPLQHFRVPTAGDSPPQKNRGASIRS